MGNQPSPNCFVPHKRRRLPPSRDALCTVITTLRRNRGVGGETSTQFAHESGGFRREGRYGKRVSRPPRTGCGDERLPIRKFFGLPIQNSSGDHPLRMLGVFRRTVCGGSRSAKLRGNDRGCPNDSITSNGRAYSCKPGGSVGLTDSHRRGGS
jgi:hypothetical protein